MQHNVQKSDAENHIEIDDSPARCTEVIGHLEANKWFSGLPRQVITELAADAEIREAARGEPIFTIGQYEGFEIYVLLNGSAQLTTASPKTGDMYIEQVHAGECIGIEYVLSGAFEFAGATALTAMEKLTFLTLDASRVIELAETSLTFAKEMTRVMALRLAEQRFDAPEQEDEAAARVVAALMELLEEDTVQTGHYIIKKMPKHRELCEMAGVSEEVAAEIIARLISDGIARRQYPGLVIEDYPSFKNILNQ